MGKSQGGHLAGATQQAWGWDGSTRAVPPGAKVGSASPGQGTPDCQHPQKQGSTEGTPPQQELPCPHPDLRHSASSPVGDKSRLLKSLGSWCCSGLPQTAQQVPFSELVRTMQQERMRFQYYKRISNREKRDFPGSPVVTAQSSKAWGKVRSLAGELRSHMTWGRQTETKQKTQAIL